MRLAAAFLSCALFALPSCKSDQPSCPCAPATLGLRVSVTNAVDGSPVPGAQAKLLGTTANTVTLSCSSVDGGPTTCDWSSGPVADGSYTLQVTAPGFQTLNAPARVTVTADAQCGCTSTSIEPMAVSLQPQ
jgi:hypothetical protein